MIMSNEYSQRSFIEIIFTNCINYFDIEDINILLQTNKNIKELIVSQYKFTINMISLKHIHLLQYILKNNELTIDTIINNFNFSDKLLIMLMKFVNKSELKMINRNNVDTLLGKNLLNEYYEIYKIHNNIKDIINILKESIDVNLKISTSIHTCIFSGLHHNGNKVLLQKSFLTDYLLYFFEIEDESYINDVILFIDVWSYKITFELDFDILLKYFSNNKNKLLLIDYKINFYEILNKYCKNELNTLFYDIMYLKTCNEEYYKEVMIEENIVSKNKKKKNYSFFKIFDLYDYNKKHGSSYKTRMRKRQGKRNSLTCGKDKFTSKRNAYFNNYLLKRNINNYIDMFEKD